MVPPQDSGPTASTSSTSLLRRSRWKRILDVAVLILLGLLVTLAGTATVSAEGWNGAIYPGAMLFLFVGGLGQQIRFMLRYRRADKLLP